MLNVAKHQKNKDRGIWHIKTCSILTADEKLKSRLKIRERDILSQLEHCHVLQYLIGNCPDMTNYLDGCRKIRVRKIREYSGALL